MARKTKIPEHYCFGDCDDPNGGVMGNLKEDLPQMGFKVFEDPRYEFCIIAVPKRGPLAKLTDPEEVVKIIDRDWWDEHFSPESKVFKEQEDAKWRALRKSGSEKIAATLSNAEQEALFGGCVRYPLKEDFDA